MFIQKRQLKRTPITLINEISLLGFRQQNAPKYSRFVTAYPFVSNHFKTKPYIGQAEWVGFSVTEIQYLINNKAL